MRNLTIPHWKFCSFPYYKRSFLWKMIRFVKYAGKKFNKRERDLWRLNMLLFEIKSLSKYVGKIQASMEPKLMVAELWAVGYLKVSWWRNVLAMWNAPGAYPAPASSALISSRRSYSTTRPRLSTSLWFTWQPAHCLDGDVSAKKQTFLFAQINFWHVYVQEFWIADEKQDLVGKRN